MNIKVAAFTVSEKYIYTIICVTTDREAVSRFVYMYFDIHTDLVHKIPGLLNAYVILQITDVVINLMHRAFFNSSYLYAGKLRMIFVSDFCFKITIFRNLFHKSCHKIKP